MSVIIDENVSASLDEKLGANVWWKPDIDKKTLKSLCVKRSSPGALYVSLYFIALITMGYLAFITWGSYWSILFLLGVGFWLWWGSSQKTYLWLHNWLKVHILLGVLGICFMYK